MLKFDKVNRYMRFQAQQLHEIDTLKNVHCYYRTDESSSTHVNGEAFTGKEQRAPNFRDEQLSCTGTSRDGRYHVS